jgi:hypothetical protein
VPQSLVDGGSHDGVLLLGGGGVGGDGGWTLLEGRFFRALRGRAFLFSVQLGCVDQIRGDGNQDFAVKRQRSPNPPPRENGENGGN